MKVKINGVELVSESVAINQEVTKDELYPPYSQEEYELGLDGDQNELEFVDDSPLFLSDTGTHYNVLNTNSIESQEWIHALDHVQRVSDLIIPF